MSKLRRRGFSEAKVREVIAELKAQGLQDQRRFVEGFIRTRAERGMGPLRIQLELKARGIAQELIDEVLSELALDWQQLAFAVCRRRYKNLPMSKAERARCYRFLARRGFAAEHIRALLEEL